MSERVTAYRVITHHGYGATPNSLTIESAGATVRAGSIMMDHEFKGDYRLTGSGRPQPLDTPRSRVDAVTAFIVERLAEIEKARKVIAEQEALIELARAMDVTS